MNYVTPILIGLSIVISNLIVWKVGDVNGYNRGIYAGIDKFHALCYDVGGYIFDDKGRVVECRPSGHASKEELEKYLKKELDKAPGI